MADEEPTPDESSTPQEEPTPDEKPTETAEKPQESKPQEKSAAPAEKGAMTAARANSLDNQHFLEETGRDIRKPDLKMIAPSAASRNDPRAQGVRLRCKPAEHTPAKMVAGYAKSQHLRYFPP